MSDRYKFVSSTQYRKDYKRCKKRGWDMELLDETVRKLCRGEKLDDIQFDHPLVGDYQEYRECHIKFDWILVYEIIDSDHLKVWKTGTHDEVLEK